MTSRQTLASFWILTGACAAAVVAYSWVQVRERRPEPSQVVPTMTPEVGAAATKSPHILFVNSAPEAGNGQLAVVALADPAGERRLSPLSCDRVDFAQGTGVCLAADRGVITTYSALVFDESLTRVSHTIPLKGVPSRVRVAPNGAMAAVTVFVAGHSYSGSDFSTSTILLDTRTGVVVADLEAFDVVRNDRPFKAVDFNFWGVTFTSTSDAFYATLSSGGVFYLVKGDIAARRAIVVGEGVECPSLSPDETRVAYKKRASDSTWHLAVRNLASGEERVLVGETRSIDDQVEWLDNQQILYGVADPELGSSRSSVWVINVESGAPRRWIPNGVSPSVLSPASQ